MPKKMGRPTDNPKCERITIRLDKEASEILAKFCKANGIEKAEAVRIAIKRLSGKNKG